MRNSAIYMQMQHRMEHATQHTRVRLRGWRLLPQRRCGRAQAGRLPGLLLTTLQHNLQGKPNKWALLASIADDNAVSLARALDASAHERKCSLVFSCRRAPVIRAYARSLRHVDTTNPFIK